MKQFKLSIVACSSFLATLGMVNTASADPAQAGYNSVAQGEDSNAGAYAAAFGKQSQAGTYGTAIGWKAIAPQQGATVIGTDSKSDLQYSTVVGCQSIINKRNSIKGESILIGSNSALSGIFSTSIGDQTSATSDFVTLLGAEGFINTGEKKEDGYYEAFNNKLSAKAKDAKIVRYKAKDRNEGTILKGDSITENNSDIASVQTFTTNAATIRSQYGDQYGAVAIGMLASAHDVMAVSQGAYATAIGYKSNSIGAESLVYGDRAMALGANAIAMADNSVAIGFSSNTEEKYADTQARFTNTENKDSENGVVSVGNSYTKRRITNVAGGVDDNDVVNVAQLQHVSDAVDTVSKTVQLNAAQTDTQVTHINNRLNTLDRDMKKGFARQSALAGLIPPMGVGRFNVTGAFGGSGSETAIAIGGGYRPNDHWNFRMGLSTNTSSGGRLDYNVASSYEW